MIRKLQPEFTSLTPEIAKQVSMMPSLLGEREIKQDRMKFHAANIKAGRFFSPNWAEAVLKGTEQRFRINGHHTSTLLANAKDYDVEFPLGEDGKPMPLVIEMWEIDSVDEDATALFNLFDNPKCARSNDDIMGLYRAHYPDLDAISNKFLMKMCNGIDLYLETSMNEDERASVLRTRDRGLHLAKDSHRNFAVAFWSFRESDHAAFLSKPGIVAEAFAEWLQDSHAAEEFWGYVLRDDHPDHDHVTRELGRTYERLLESPRKPKADIYRKKANATWKIYQKLRQVEAPAA